tara:strand:+ start:3635 stop:3787 length:153 start_codon:yes stop_codon:yes gene_type:complete
MNALFQEIYSRETAVFAVVFLRGFMNTIAFILEKALWGCAVFNVRAWGEM